MNMTLMPLHYIILFTLLISTGYVHSDAEGADNNEGSPGNETVTLTLTKPAILEDGAIEKGLAAHYYLGYFKRDVRYLQKMISGEFDNFRGKPILEINHQFNREKVFDSDTKQGVAVRMRGYILFTAAGLYKLQALSNDGIVLYLDSHLLLSDPKQHADRLSNIGEVIIEKPGNYPVAIDYFQRKGTAALKLFWQRPGDSDFQIIPATVYSHLP